ncbi:MAG: thiamine-monophosphate kinase (thiL) [Candidatus Bathyarchaeota archaeon B63]|nr:MAG: thiamine-monophosphate kinase (thiL) [Candidatus Bathyarchaeota archaeon B63]
MNGSEPLGERRIIRIIQEQLEVMAGLPLGFGDDVSAISIDDGRLAVLKADMLVGKTDIPPGMSVRQAARKAVVMNVSDFAAKGVEPLVILASLGLPRELGEDDVREIGRGLNEAAREYGAYVIGGDTNESSDLIISCSLLGFSEEGRLISRCGAKPGDIVAVTGEFGRTAAGLKILMEGLSAPEEIEEPLREAVLMPKARLREGVALSGTGVVTSSIDSSDGLAWSLHELSDASRVGFTIDSLPIAEEALEFAGIHGLDPWELALYGGEEYELVVTVRPDGWGEAEAAVREAGGSLLRIGVVTEEVRVELRVDGETRPIERRGWEHFKMG